MSIQVLTNYFIVIWSIFYLPDRTAGILNLSGFPAGVIMPLAGYLGSKRGKIGFPMVMLLSVAAGLVGSWALYLLGRLGGTKVMEFYFRKFPKQQPVIEDKMQMIREKGCIGVFVSKLLPMVRTIISIPAGMVRMDFLKYTVSSVCGIFIWNLVFIGAGYSSARRQSGFWDSGEE